MGNPSSGCTTVQVPMSLSKRRHRQSLSLQLEQLGQLGSINSSEKKKSASALSSPKVKEEKSASSFFGSKPVARRKQSSLCGTEEYLKGIELHGGASSDRKPTSFNPFRGHRRIGSGSTVAPCKSLESSFRKEKTLESPREKGGSLSFRNEKTTDSPREKGGSLSFRKEKTTDSPREKGGSLSFRKEKTTDSPREKGGSLSFRKEKTTDSPREKGGSLSFRKDRFAVAKIAASLFHSPTKVERTMSMSRVTQKAIQAEEVVSLRQQFQMSSDDGPQMAPLSGNKGSGLHSLAQDVEESAQPLISSSSAVQNECVIDSSTLVEDDHKGDEEDQLPSPTIVDSPTFTRHPSELLSDHDSQVFVNASESELSNLNLVSLCGASNNDLQLGELNPYRWTRKTDVTTQSTLLSSSEKLLLYSLESNSKSCAGVTPEDILSQATGPSSIGSQSSRMETDSSEEIGGEKVYAVDDIPSLLFVTEKVTEEELTEAAVRSSLMSEEYLTGPLFFSSEDSQKNLLKTDWRTHEASLDARNDTGLRASCDSDACLKKCMSFEPVARGTSEAEPDRKSKARKRRRSVSASGIGAMLLKVVRVSDSGPMLTRRLPKVGPEVISGADAIRAREYVLQKTAQISMGRTLESSSPVSASAACQCESNEVAKSTSFKSELDSKGDGVEVEKHPKDDPEGVDGTGCRVDCTFDSRQLDQQSTLEMVPRHPAIPENTNSGIVFSHEEMTPTLVEVESSFHERVARVNSNLQRTTPDGQSEWQTKTILVNGSANASAGENADERRSGKTRKKPSSRGRNSYDSDSLTEGPKTARSNSTLGRNAAKLASLSTLDANVAITRERSRSFKSRLQAPSGISSVDVFHLAPSSISILANPSFSSSHQDRLWEEQAEAYSSGGRGTPGRDDEAAPVANVFLQSPSPGVAISSDDHQVPSASASLRRGIIDSSVGAGCVDKGRHKRKGKRGRPHTPLRSLLADDAHSKCSPSSASRPSPEGGHFIQQIMSRIRGTPSSKSLSPKSPHNVSKRRSIWSSCICFSIKCQA